MNLNEKALKQAEVAVKLQVNEDLFKSGKIPKYMYDYAKKQLLKNTAA